MLNKKSSYFSILISLGIILSLLYQLPNMKFDYDLENFFPTNDPDLAYYRQFSEKFGFDNDYVLVSIESTHGIFNSEYLHEIDSISNQISSLDKTARVISLTQLKDLIKTPLGTVAIPKIHLEVPDRLLSDSVKIAKDTRTHDMFISKNGKSMKLIVMHNRLSDKYDADSYVEQLTQVLTNRKGLKTRIIGKIVAQKTFVDAVEKDFSKFIIGAVVLIIILLKVFMRNVSLIITSMLIAGLSVGSTLGIMVLFDKKIDVLSSLIPSILLVVAMSDIIHLFTNIKKESEKGKSTTLAINDAMKNVGKATFLTSFTTAVGFLSLVTINVIPIIDLGIYAAVGILIAFFVTYFWFPQIAILTNATFEKKGMNIDFQPPIKSLLNLVFKRKKIILTTWLIILSLVLGGLSLLTFNAYLIDELPQESAAKSDFKYFDKQYAGTRPFTLSIWLTDSSLSIYDPIVITQIALIEKTALEKIKVGDIISPVTYVRAANQAVHNGSHSFNRIPVDKREWKEVKKFLKKIPFEKKFTKVSTQYEAQIIGFYEDNGSKLGNDMSNILLEELALRIDKQIIDYKLTGTSLLIDKSQKNLPINLIKGLFTAMLIVSFIAAWLFKSWKMILITLVPNLLPIFITASIMGYFGIPINLSTSVIFAISFGIVVDDTIHFLVHFKEEYISGKSKIYAIKSTLMHVSEPIIITTTILTAGFLIFCFSSFSATFYTGLFVSISFVVALLADLTLLPILILLYLPKHARKGDSKQ
jgi:predicted RND superfamily exporter protein